MYKLRLGKKVLLTVHETIQIFNEWCFGFDNIRENFLSVVVAHWDRGGGWVRFTEKFHYVVSREPPGDTLQRSFIPAFLRGLRYRYDITFLEIELREDWEDTFRIFPSKYSPIYEKRTQCRSGIRFWNPRDENASSMNASWLYG